MAFLSILLALFVERVLQQHRPRREHRWFDRYYEWLARAPFAQWLLTRPWGALVVLLPPLLLIAWLQAFCYQLGAPVGLLFGVVVLLYSLGPQDLGDQAAAFIAARDAGPSEQADTAAQALCLSEVPPQEPRRSFAVANAVVVLAARRLIAPIFWFVAFGGVGAAAYRAILLLSERQRRAECPQDMQRYSDEMRHIADWAPARVTAAGYAIAGNFDAVAHAWRTFSHSRGKAGTDEAERLLAHTGRAALDTYRYDTHAMAAETEDAFDAAPTPPVVEEALALVWRSLAVWVTIIAGGSLVAVLA